MLEQLTGFMHYETPALGNPVCQYTSWSLNRPIRPIAFQMLLELVNLFSIGKAQVNSFYNGKITEILSDNSYSEILI